MARNRNVDEVIWLLAGALKPITLAAILADLQENDQLREDYQRLQDRISNAFEQQLKCMVGEDDASRMLIEAGGF